MFLRPGLTRCLLALTAACQVKYLRFLSLLLLSLLLSGLRPASAQLTTLVNFTGANGSLPYGSLILGSDGNFYGTTYYGGSNHDGTVFKMTPDGTLTTLVSFTGTNGSDPAGSLILGSDGNFYGTTSGGGPTFSTDGGSGTIFKMTPSGTLTTLVNFAGTNGSKPYGSLILGSDGHFYGTTQYGGPTANGNPVSGNGTIFKMTPSGTLTTLVNFAGTNGSNPHGSLILVSDGNFYGTTGGGGPTFSTSNGGSGTVFKMTPSGTITTLVSFTGTNGDNPAGSLILGGDGSFYGTTSHGGTTYNGTSNSGSGTVFKLTVASIAPGPTHVLWDNTNGTAALWNYTPATGAYSAFNFGPYTNWTAKAIADGGTDGKTRMLWNNTNGTAALWNVTSSTGAFTTSNFGPYSGWTANAVSVAKVNTTHILWNNTNGAAALWNVVGGAYQSEHDFGPYAGWTAKAIADGGTDGKTRMLWTNTNGTAAFWNVNPGTGAFSQFSFGPYAGWTAKAISVSATTTHVLWSNTNGTQSVWNYNPANGAFTSQNYGPYSGWTATAIADGSDGKTRLLWDNTDGTASFWHLDNSTGLFGAFSFGPYSGWTAVAISAGS